jgi:hypothetical protein
MVAISSNGGNSWNILGFNFTKRDALSSVYNISTMARASFLGVVSFGRFAPDWGLGSVTISTVMVNLP